MQIQLAWQARITMLAEQIERKFRLSKLPKVADIPVHLHFLQYYTVDQMSRAAGLFG